MSEISIENYFEGAPIEWKGLDVAKEEHITLLGEYAREHTSKTYNQVVDSAIDTIEKEGAGIREKSQALEVIEQGFLIIDVDYLYSYLKEESHGDLRWFYSQYGIYDPEQIYEVY